MTFLCNQQRKRRVYPTFYFFFLCALLTFLHHHPVQVCEAALTHDGRPGGQTLVPRGVDYFDYTLVRVGVSKRRRRSNKQQSTTTITSPTPTPTTTPAFVINTTTTKPHNKRLIRRRIHTLWTSSPFYTLRDFTCASFPITSVKNNDGYIGAIRTVSSKDLARRSSSFSSSSSSTTTTATTTTATTITTTTVTTTPPLFVLFHGGNTCEWSVKFWTTWINATRMLRASCLVAIDGAKDSMMNYNLMVLGFPTVMRIRGEDSVETFRMNRTAESLVEWIVNNGGVAPLGHGHGIEDDIKWLNASHLYDAEHEKWTGPLEIDVSTNAIENARKFNWPLFAANLVFAVHCIRGLILFAMSMARRKARRKEQNSNGRGSMTATENDDDESEIKID